MLLRLAVKRAPNCKQNSCSLHTSKAPALKLQLQQQRERLVDSHLKCQSLARRGLCLLKGPRNWLLCLLPKLTVGLKTRSRSWSLTCLAAPWRFALGLAELAKWPAARTCAAASTEVQKAAERGRSAPALCWRQRLAAVANCAESFVRCRC